jgi:heme/copper-type cytochrome/quinol oxidase subunit 4
MKILGTITIIAIACTLLCGLWMKFGPGEKDVNFHAVLSVGTILLCLVTIILFMIKMKG